MMGFLARPPIAGDTGVVGSLAVSVTPSGMSFGVSATDLSTILRCPALLFVVVLVASLLPARIAASVEPMITLRNE
jgi:ABC-type lipoprotein release transport system permease subunit